MSIAMRKRIIVRPSVVVEEKVVEDVEKNVSGREMGLSKIASNQKYQLINCQNEINFTSNLLIQMIINGRMTSEELWDYILNKPVPEVITTDTTPFGILSVIKDYTTKKGVTYLAHFSINGCFLRKVVGDDNIPTGYIGNLYIKQYSDKLMFKMNINAKKLGDFFVYKC